MNSKKIRKSFIDFFIENDHKFVRSSPVVPIDDPTLLFTNAGMNQFKSIFLDQTKSDFNRAVNSQKCIRVSGKHNDLEEVGVDGFHHTFFEMLGNWSFGDYYKSEAIKWAWQLLTEVWELDKERLWVTVYHKDKEAYDLWPKITDISPDRVLKFDKKDNFWEMGNSGPCGPCSEIHYYIGSDISKQSPKGVNVSNEYWELWNLVFIQHNRLENGSIDDLKSKHVDTGAGFERIVSVMQGQLSNYSTDLFQPIIKQIETISAASYKTDPVPFQVISDHVRMLCFAISDGALPSNEGRGYVLRRILRRAARYGRMINMSEPFIFELVSSVGDVMGDTFPEVIDKKLHIEKIIKSEELSFNDTLDRGLSHFKKVIKNVSGKKVSGADAFKLYDTFGFPLDLTELMAREKGLVVDVKGFDREMNHQKKRAKGSDKFVVDVTNKKWKELSKDPDSIFVGYETTTLTSKIVRYVKSDDSFLLVLNQTPFYAEAGGQVGDKGTIKGSNVDLEVYDVQLEGETYIHYCRGTMNPKAKNVECKVDDSRRQRTRKNHTATHLMHKALKVVLGGHVQQAGSLVHPDYLRFDLTHFEKISSDQIERIEKIVNDEITKNTELDVSVKPYDDAKNEGAVAMFGEKYGDEVRVITVGDYSKELCGGTHVERTGDIGFFKIIEESSLASGVRRVVAVTGPESVSFVQNQSLTLSDIKSQLNCSLDSISERISQLISDKKILEKKLKNNRKLSSNFNVDSILKESQLIKEVTVFTKLINANSIEDLKDIGNLLIQKVDKGIGVLGADLEKPSIVVVVSNALVDIGVHAGIIAKDLGSMMGGGGGGRPNMATAGGKNKKSLNSALEKAQDVIKKNLEGKNAV
ncbi:MAG: alanine--tRNA ligase [Candidatus Neomarinimicrobiota bacterium]|nr:alanine--tRNA ligase [Candidatus Neomarinimicrobiota bacterium]